MRTPSCDSLPTALIAKFTGIQFPALPSEFGKKHIYRVLTAALSTKDIIVSRSEPLRILPTNAAHYSLRQWSQTLSFPNNCSPGFTDTAGRPLRGLSRPKGGGREKCGREPEQPACRLPARARDGARYPSLPLFSRSASQEPGQRRPHRHGPGESRCRWADVRCRRQPHGQPPPPPPPPPLRPDRACTLISSPLLSSPLPITRPSPALTLFRQAEPGPASAATPTESDRKSVV